MNFTFLRLVVLTTSLLFLQLISITMADSLKSFKDIMKVDPTEFALNLDVSEEAIKEFNTLFMFIGFNPLLLLQVLANRAAASGRTTDEFKRDIQAMITLFAIRGSVTQKHLDKTGEDGRERVLKLAQVYKIDLTPKPKDFVPKYKPTDVTFPRVAAVFPLAMLSIAKAGYVNQVLKRSDYGCLELPVELRHPVSASLIPGGLEVGWHNTIRLALIAYNMEVDAVINSNKERNIDEKARMDLIQQYITAQMDSPMVSDTVRYEKMKTALFYNTDLPMSSPDLRLRKEIWSVAIKFLAAHKLKRSLLPESGRFASA